jgi:hypothetical protein
LIHSLCNDTVVEEVDSEDERARQERERLAQVVTRPRTPDPETDEESDTSEESLQPSVEGLLDACRVGDADSVAALLEAGTDWDCETKVVRSHMYYDTHMNAYHR